MTDMNETHEVILKTDRRGRLRYSQEQKQALLDAFDASGLSGPRFAAHHGVHYQTLVSWLRKRRQAGGEHPAFKSLVPAVIEREQSDTAPTAPIEIKLPCGMKLIVHSPSQIDMAVTLVRKLHPNPPC